MEIFELVNRLASYGVKTGLCESEDVVFVKNQLLMNLNLDGFPDQATAEALFDVETDDLEEILKGILDYAVEKKLIDSGIASRDLFDTKLMGSLCARPSEITKKFNELYKKSSKDATDWFYKFSGDSDYIRRYRIKKDLKWLAKTEYGDLDITINLSKPEKDPKAIAAARLSKSVTYPQCLLCKENVGYAGRLDHAARETIRIIPLELAGEKWGFQYSPYVYYNEHCIVFSFTHSPMKIYRKTFERLFDFVTLFPHYTLGSNADLPIVGGSILTHDHFQGGAYEFPMARAGISKKVTFKGFEDIEAGILNWPMSVLRLKASGANAKERLIELSDKILTAWRSYTDEDAFVFAETDGTPHNTITPIARRRGEAYEIDLVLRNNITTEEHPLGVYHPHAELHHIKKENIGLIEVMGLAVLPSRLKEELALLVDAIKTGADITKDERISKHADWVEEIKKKHSIITEDVLKEEVGIVFSKVLEHAGVYKDLSAFEKFVASVSC